MTLEKAADPEDLIIQNLHITSKRIFLGKLVIYSLTAIFLLIIIAVTMFLTRYKNSIDYIENSTLYLVISIILSLFTLVVNKILVYSIPIITEFEKNHTFTDYETNVAFKIGITLFINSSIIPLLSIFFNNKQYFFKNSGLIETIWINWVLVAILPPIIEIVNPLYLLNKLKILWLECCSDEEQSDLAQIDANKLFEGIAISLVDKYAELISLLFFTAFYISFIPIASVITIIGLILFYFVNKYLLLFRYKKPFPIGYKISTYSTALIGCGCSILYAVL